MKKKIKDLTVKEFQKICGKYEYCHNCPLHLAYGLCSVIDFTSINEKDLEKEVEVDE